MEPELRLYDILLIAPNPKPGGLVVAKLENQDEVIVRKYKQLSPSNQEFLLTAINDNWAPIQVFIGSGNKIIGSVKGIYRFL